jgi:hypothetical protein
MPTVGQLMPRDAWARRGLPRDLGAARARFPSFDAVGGAPIHFSIGMQSEPVDADGTCLSIGVHSFVITPFTFDVAEQKDTNHGVLYISMKGDVFSRMPSLQGVNNSVAPCVAPCASPYETGIAIHRFVIKEVQAIAAAWAAYLGSETLNRAQSLIALREADLPSMQALGRGGPLGLASPPAKLSPP